MANLIGQDLSHRTTISYARYLMACHLKRLLAPHEHVDHKDNNKLNDSLENLQILTPAENLIKAIKNSKGKTFIKFICPICLAEFELEARQSHKDRPCCSRRCGRIKAAETLALTLWNKKFGG